MQETYTYGYQNGFDITNKYIKEFNKLIEEKHTNDDLIIYLSKLESKLRKYNYELNIINLKSSPKYIGNQNLSSNEILKKYRKEYDDVFLEIKLLKHAVELIRKYTEENKNIDRVLIDIDDSIKENNKRYEENNRLLEEYNEAVEEFNLLTEKYNDNKISSEEYDAEIKNMLSKYKDNPEIEKYIKENKKKYEQDNIHSDQSIIMPPTTQQNITEPYTQENEENKDEVIKIKNIEHKPKVTLKTAAAIALGIGAGTLVFSIGPTGVIVGNMAAALSKIYISKKKKEAHKKGWITKDDVVLDIVEPDTKIKRAIYETKKYLKSEEGLRDISYFLTSEIATSSILSVADKAGLFMKSEPEIGTIQVDNSLATETPSMDPPLNNINDVSEISDIRVGDSLGNNVPTTGHDSASWALNDINSEVLNHNYIDGNSTIKRIVGYDPSGNLLNFDSVSEAINAGFDPSELAVDIAKDGVSQSWNTLSDIGYEAVDTVGKVL